LCTEPAQHSPASLNGIFELLPIGGVTAALLTFLIFVAALLYSTVGHGGASGYLAAMALFNVSPSVMKPTALVLNLFVAGVGTIRYVRAGCFSWNLFWPFAVASIPFAFIGGSLSLPIHAYKLLLGVVLLFAAWRLAVKPSPSTSTTQNPLPLSAGLGLGAVIGLMSGLTGVGGGIFLSPLLLLFRWADVRTTAGISAAFILVNSASGLLGHLQSVQLLPREIYWWTPAAFIGGLIGAELGSRRLTPLLMRRLLSAVLLVAGLKMLLTK
jgi:uncharacterized membrane protein YfcA